MLLFLVIQLILSWLSLRRLIGRRTATFFQLIQQEEPDDMVGGSPRRGGPRSPKGDGAPVRMVAMLFKTNLFAVMEVLCVPKRVS